MQNSFPLETLADTQHLAQIAVTYMPRGTLLILSGELGSGKTTFTQHLAQVMGSRAAVTSPTYTLVHEYPPPQGTLVHIDAYRLDSADALFELGLEDYLERSRLIAVEWGLSLLESYPDARHIAFYVKDDKRSASLNFPALLH